jgi:hypothetical protein
MKLRFGCISWHRPSCQRCSEPLLCAQPNVLRAPHGLDDEALDGVRPTASATGPSTACGGAHLDGVRPTASATGPSTACGGAHLDGVRPTASATGPSTACAPRPRRRGRALGVETMATTTTTHRPRNPRPRCACGKAMRTGAKLCKACDRIRRIQLRDNALSQISTGRCPKCGSAIRRNTLYRAGISASNMGQTLTAHAPRIPRVGFRL